MMIMAGAPSSVWNSYRHGTDHRIMARGIFNLSNTSWGKSLYIPIPFHSIARIKAFCLIFCKGVWGQKNLSIISCSSDLFLHWQRRSEGESLLQPPFFFHLFDENYIEILDRARILLNLKGRGPPYMKDHRTANLKVVSTIFSFRSLFVRDFCFLSFGQFMT